VRPELAGNGATPQRCANAASDLSRPGFVAGGDQQLPGNFHPDADDLEQLRCGGLDQGGEMLVSLSYLLGERLVSAGQHPQRLLDRVRRRGHRGARPQSCAREDKRRVAKWAQLLAQLGGRGHQQALS
jgi:hypothetical protein